MRFSKNSALSAPGSAAPIRIPRHPSGSSQTQSWKAAVGNHDDKRHVAESGWRVAWLRWTGPRINRRAPEHQRTPKPGGTTRLPVLRVSVLNCARCCAAPSQRRHILEVRARTFMILVRMNGSAGHRPALRGIGWQAVAARFANWIRVDSCPFVVDPNRSSLVRVHHPLTSPGGYKFNLIAAVRL